MTFHTNCIATSLTSSGSISSIIPPPRRKHIFCVCLSFANEQTIPLILPLSTWCTHFLSFSLSLANANIVAHELQSWIREISCDCIYFSLSECVNDSKLNWAIKWVLSICTHKHFGFLLIAKFVWVVFFSPFVWYCVSVASELTYNLTLLSSYFR